MALIIIKHEKQPRSRKKISESSYRPEESLNLSINPDKTFKSHELPAKLQKGHTCSLEAEMQAVYPQSKPARVQPAAQHHQGVGEKTDSDPQREQKRLEG